MKEVAENNFEEIHNKIDIAIAGAGIMHVVSGTPLDELVERQEEFRSDLAEAMELPVGELMILSIRPHNEADYFTE